MYSGCRHGGYALILLSSMAPAPAWGQQFFGGDPLAGVANATLMVSFMQHVESLSQPVDYGDYGGLHQGIDVWEDTGDSVFSPNTSQALAAIVVDVDPYYGQILLASQNCLETEAIMLAHLVEIDPALDTGDELEPNTFLGLVDGGVGHLHVDYYRDFSANLMFDNCPDAPGGSFFTEEGNEERKHYLRNPLIHAFQTADWAEDPDTEPCHPKAVASVHYATDSLCYVALARASDQTQRASFFGPTWCKTGIYRMEFLVDGEIEDEWTLVSFEKKFGALATDADFY